MEPSPVASFTLPGSGSMITDFCSSPGTEDTLKFKETMQTFIIIKNKLLILSSTGGDKYFPNAGAR